MALKKVNIGRSDDLILNVGYYVRFKFAISDYFEFYDAIWYFIKGGLKKDYKERFEITKIKYDKENDYCNIEGYPSKENETLDTLDFEAYILRYTIITMVSLVHAYYYQEGTGLGSGGNDNGNGKDVLKSPLLFIGIGTVSLLILLLIIFLIRK